MRAQGIFLILPISLSIFRIWECRTWIACSHRIAIKKAEDKKGKLLRKNLHGNQPLEWKFEHTRTLTVPKRPEKKDQ